MLTAVRTARLMFSTATLGRFTEARFTLAASRVASPRTWCHIKLDSETPCPKAGTRTCVTLPAGPSLRAASGEHPLNAETPGSFRTAQFRPEASFPAAQTAKSENLVLISAPGADPGGGPPHLHIVPPPAPEPLRGRSLGRGQRTRHQAPDNSAGSEPCCPCPVLSLDPPERRETFLRFRHQSSSCPQPSVLWETRAPLTSVLRVLGCSTWRPLRSKTAVGLQLHS